MLGLVIIPTNPRLAYRTKFEAQLRGRWNRVHVCAVRSRHLTYHTYTYYIHRDKYANPSLARTNIPLSSARLPTFFQQPPIKLVLIQLLTFVDLNFIFVDLTFIFVDLTFIFVDVTFIFVLHFPGKFFWSSQHEINQARWRRKIFFRGWNKNT